MSEMDEPEDDYWEPIDWSTYVVPHSPTVDFVGWGGHLKKLPTTYNLGWSAHVPNYQTGTKRMMFDIAYGHVNGFPFRDILYFVVTRSMSKRIKDRVLAWEAVHRQWRQQVEN